MLEREKDSQDQNVEDDDIFFKKTTTKIDKETKRRASLIPNFAQSKTHGRNRSELMKPATNPIVSALGKFYREKTAVRHLKELSPRSLQEGAHRRDNSHSDLRRVGENKPLQLPGGGNQAQVNLSRVLKAQFDQVKHD